MNNFNFLAAMMVLFFVVPWITGFISTKLKKTQRSYLVYYRHFVVINVFLTSLFVGLRLMLESQIPASAFSPVLQSLTIQYGAMILLIGIISAISALQSNILKIIPALSWAPMLTIAAVLDALTIFHNPALMHSTLMLHAINNCVVAATLFAFAALIYKKERRIITCFAGSTETI
jgi:hypothetical protein